MTWADGRSEDFGAVGHEATRRLARWIQQLLTLARRQLDLPTGASAPPTAAHLARLRVLVAIRAAAGEQITDEVHAAGNAGASYADIAGALHMTRQNARKRWPVAVDHPPGPRPHGSASGSTPSRR